MSAVKKSVHRETTIAEAMSNPVLTVEVDESLWDAWQLLFVSGLRHLVVLNEDGVCLGVLSDRNILAEVSGDGPLIILWRQINNPLIWVLIGSGILAVALGKVTDGSVVLAVVVLNSIIGFYQEYRAGKAIEALRGMVPEFANALRDGTVAVVPVVDLVEDLDATLVEERPEADHLEAFHQVEELVVALTKNQPTKVEKETTGEDS